MEKTNYSWTGWSIDYVKDECLILSVKYLNKGRKKIPTTIFKLLGPCESISYGQKFWVLSRRPHNFQTFRTVREYLLRAKILSFEPEASHISQFVTVVTVIDMHVSIGKAAAAQETTSRNGIVLPFNLSTSSRRTAYCPKKSQKSYPLSELIWCQRGTQASLFFWQVYVKAKLPTKPNHAKVRSQVGCLDYRTQPIFGLKNTFFGR